MLYLSRKVGESIIINNNIEVMVVEVRGKTAKLGFTFPPEASILRKEVHQRIYEQNLAASQSIPEDALHDIVLELDMPQTGTESANEKDEKDKP